MKYQSILLIAIIVVAWQAIASASLIPTTFVASPEEIFYALEDMIVEGSIWSDIAATIRRTLLAFLVSLGIGTPLGVFVGYFEKVGYSLELLLDFLRSLPPIALFPLFILFFGIGEESKIAVGAFMGTMIITVAAIHGTKHIKKTRLMLAKKIGLKGKNLFFKFLLPESLPTIFTGYKLAASLCLILVIVAEIFLAGQKGIGSRLVDAQMLYNIPELYALIVLTGMFGYLLNKLLLAIEKKTIHWI